MGSLLTPCARICLVVRRAGSFSYSPRAGNCLVSRQVRSLILHAPCFNPSRPAGGEFLLHAPCWNLSCGSSVRESLTRSVSSLSGSGVSLTRPTLEFVSSFVGKGISLTRPVLVCLISACASFYYTFRDGICQFVRRLGFFS